MLPPTEPDTVAELRGGAVIVPAPSGLCVDAVSSDARAGFAVLAPCVAMTGEGAATRNSAIITVQVGEAGSATVAGAENAMVTLLESNEGETLLSDNAAVDVLSTASTDNDVRVAYEEQDPPSIAGTTGTVRRAFFDVQQYLVTVSVRSLQASPLSASAGRFLLIDLVRGIKNANLEPVAIVEPIVVSEPDDALRPEETSLFPLLQQFGRYVTSKVSPQDGA